MTADPNEGEVATLVFRAATPSDLPFIIGLIAGDNIAKPGDDPAQADAPIYREALEAITSDPRQMLVVAEYGGQPVGTLQLTFIPGLSRRGMWRCLIENVQVAPDRRSQGLGGAMMRWAIEQARARGCGVVQLTSNKARLDAHRFYERLGFSKSHEGFKLFL